jgi:hypothetical protein
MENGIDLLYFPSHSSHLLQPLDVGYFHVLKAKVSEILSGLGYAVTRSLPRHLFPKVLHQAMNRITPATVAASFSATGIYPYNKSSVKALAGPVKKIKNVQSTSSTTDVSKDAPVSGHVPNMLVKIGMVPESLAKVFLEPPALEPSKKRRTTYDKARVVESKHTKKSEGHLKKVKSAESQLKSTPLSPLPECVSGTAVVADPMSDDGVCEICMTSRQLYWVGCDRCDTWYHYECLPSSEQTDVDISLVCETLWLCNTCRKTEE